jgi:hypothetical protein
MPARKNCQLMLGVLIQDNITHKGNVDKTEEEVKIG